MTGARALRRKNPSLASATTPSTEHLHSAVTHGNVSSATWSLAIRAFDMNTVELSLVPHPCLARQNHDIAEQFETLRTPATESCGSYQFRFNGSIKRMRAAMFLHKFEFWSVSENCAGNLRNSHKSHLLDPTAGQNATAGGTSAASKMRALF